MPSIGGICCKSKNPGEALTTTDDAWMGEIDILQQVLTPWKEECAQIVFEYEIPRMGKRIEFC